MSLKKINKEELIKSIAEKTEMQKKDVTLVFESTFEAIEEHLKMGDKENKISIFIPKFGTFESVYKEASKGRNPSTGASIDIPAKNVVKFKISKNLKDSVK